MRHVWSLLSGLVLAPVAFLLLALGAAGPSGQRMHGDAAGYALAIGAYALAAILLGLLATLRVSPLGAIAAGAAFIAVQAADLAAGDRALAAGWKIGGLDLAPGKVTGSWLAFVVGVLLLVAVLSGQRWRSWPRPAPDPAAGPVDPIVDTGRIAAVSTWSPFPGDTHAPQHAAGPSPEATPPPGPPPASPWSAPPAQH
jgi:hypothetical protein